MVPEACRVVPGTEDAMARVASPPIVHPEQLLPELLSQPEAVITTNCEGDKLAPGGATQAPAPVDHVLVYNFLGALLPAVCCCMCCDTVLRRLAVVLESMTLVAE